MSTKKPIFKSLDDYFKFLDEYWTLFKPSPRPKFHDKNLKL